ncbi:MAG: hypothetical protein M3342_25215 [Bacteroidota bacterium]|nr:hypothetical protein [Bacteroidota bacterium]
MKTIALDLVKGQNLKELSAQVENNNIKIGKDALQLILYSPYDGDEVWQSGFLYLLATYFVEEKNKCSQKTKADALCLHNEKKTYYEIIFRDWAVNELENKIKEDFKIHIEWEKKDPLDDAFGMWKKDKRTLNEIRDKAWQRTK